MKINTFMMNYLSFVSLKIFKVLILDRAPPGYIELNWQEKLTKGGRPLKPLFNFVNETLFERPIYKVI